MKRYIFLFTLYSKRPYDPTKQETEQQLHHHEHVISLNHQALLDS